MEELTAVKFSHGVLIIGEVKPVPVSFLIVTGKRKDKPTICRVERVVIFYQEKGGMRQKHVNLRSPTWTASNFQPTLVREMRVTATRLLSTCFECPVLLYIFHSIG